MRRGGWIATRSAALASTSGSRSPPTRCPSSASAALIGIGLIVTDSASSSGRELGVARGRLVDLAGGDEVAEPANLAADEVRGDADAAAAADLEERQQEVVVARVQRQPGLDDRPCLVVVGRRLLDGDHVRVPSRRAAMIEPGSRLTTTRCGML